MPRREAIAAPEPIPSVVIETCVSWVLEEGNFEVEKHETVSVCVEDDVDYFLCVTHVGSKLIRFLDYPVHLLDIRFKQQFDFVVLLHFTLLPAGFLGQVHSYEVLVYC
jgi:hypothetical protein